MECHTEGSCQPVGGSPSHEPRRGVGVWKRGSNPPPPPGASQFPPNPPGALTEPLWQCCVCLSVCVCVCVCVSVFLRVYSFRKGPSLMTSWYPPTWKAPPKTQGHPPPPPGAPWMSTNRLRVVCIGTGPHHVRAPACACPAPSKQTKDLHQGSFEHLSTTAPPPPLPQRLGQIGFRAFGQSINFSLAPISLDQKLSSAPSAPLKAQHQTGGWTHPPTPTPAFNGAPTRPLISGLPTPRGGGGCHFWVGLVGPLFKISFCPTRTGFKILRWVSLRDPPIWSKAWP